MAVGDRTVIRGNTDAFTATVQDGDEVAIDITDWEFWFTVRKQYAPTDETSDVDAEISVDGVIVSAPAGTVSFDVTSTDTDIDAFSYFYDIQYKKDDGTIGSTGAYSYIIKNDVTRDR